MVGARRLGLVDTTAVVYSLDVSQFVLQTGTRRDKTTKPRDAIPIPVCWCLAGGCGSLYHVVAVCPATARGFVLLLGVWCNGVVTSLVYPVLATPLGKLVQVRPGIATYASHATPRQYTDAGVYTLYSIVIVWSFCSW